MELFTAEEKAKAERLELEIKAGLIEKARQDSRRLTDQLGSEIDPSKLDDAAFNAAWDLLGKESPKPPFELVDGKAEPMKMSDPEFTRTWNDLGRPQSDDGHPIAKLFDSDRSKPMATWLDGMSKKVGGE